MSDYCDIVIAGGGMVGISLALQLARELPPDVSICLVESHPLPAPLTGRGIEYHPSFDARSTALSYSSSLIYESLDIWKELMPWLCPIENIHVSSRGRFGSALMCARDYGWPALGYVVENPCLGNVLIQALYRGQRVEVRSPCRVQSARSGAGAIILTLSSGDEVRAGLLVIADGAASALRERLGMAATEKTYHQHALVANITSARSHGGRAFERFTAEGPVAMLPLLSLPGAEHRSALVWTVTPEVAAQLKACSDGHFLQQLQRIFGYRLGRLVQVGERHSYPLSLVQSGEQVRRGVVVMGNAAHSLHPVAGQGFNLALRDAVCLSGTLAAGCNAGLAVGDLANLQRYERHQRADQQRTISLSDRLPQLFTLGDPVLGLARDLALSGLDVLPTLKQNFVRYAAGAAALGE